MNKIPKILNEEDIDVVIDQIVNDRDTEKSGTAIETYESKEELKVSQEDDFGQPIVTNLDDLNEKQMNDIRAQAIFKRSRQNNISFLIISQDYNELHIRTVRAIGNIYHIFQPNNFRDVQNLCQDKASKDMTLNEFNYITSTSWDMYFSHLWYDQR